MSRHTHAYDVDLKGKVCTEYTAISINVVGKTTQQDCKVILV